ncbi:protein Mis18-beta [Takifugu rubripes]|uniref:Mis18 domain-containing protein n=2 Tax=Takifugu TaxID=31032 RepID=A0A3B5KA07_TAKRU|nr:protein Mis18-beta [Takifugu rubripes]XP_056914682.1 protein Mis18-beta [Takifugu flavidus]TWW71723.1 hypothetical protein D4764_16G0002200 [Takifugu flavidus]|eukprot:XP_011613303.1 PREDICTED: protein Mis18-beta [Takifugu rubripes]
MNMEFNRSILIKSASNMKAREVTQRLLTLHCQHCHTVLGDSVDICGETKYLDSIICLKVTGDVVVCDPVTQPQEEGEMANCIYSPLKCGCCCSSVGKVIHSAPPCLSTLRSLFLLKKANISCYVLKSSSMVMASALQFSLKAVTKDMEEVKQEFREFLDQLAFSESRLVSRIKTRKNKK